MRLKKYDRPADCGTTRHGRTPVGKRYLFSRVILSYRVVPQDDRIFCEKPVKPITDFDRYADQLLCPFLDTLRPHRRPKNVRVAKFVRVFPRTFLSKSKTERQFIRL
jgi:hypothetical protein